MKVIEGSSIRTGRWTDKEKKMFTDGLDVFGSDWENIAGHIKTRSASQVRSHAQKYFIQKRSKVLSRSECDFGMGFLSTQKAMVDKGVQYGEGISFLERSF